MMEKIFGKIVDVINRRVEAGVIYIEDGRISKKERIEEGTGRYILPGFVDGHVHIESSMLSPANFAEAAVRFGTVGVVSDPHEIANVMGIEGIDWMIGNGRDVPFRFYFGVPSCVPATPLETSGAVIGPAEVGEMVMRDDIYFLAEMMNYPGVISGDPAVVAKIKAARKAGKRIDGHAPGLTGRQLEKYAKAGIETDHECSTLEEAVEKIALGMKILIREGSAARNLEALHGLFKDYPDKLMLCCDDIHPEMLRERHIDSLVRILIGKGYDIFDVLRAASYNVIEHYGLDAGLLREGDNADFIIVESLEKMEVLETWIGGKKVFDRGEVMFSVPGCKPVNRFNCSRIDPDSLRVPNNGGRIKVIRAIDGELITERMDLEWSSGSFIEPEPGIDILKIVVKDRYNDGKPSIGFIRGFGLKRGAFASSVAHDSHNVIAVGTSDEEIASAINRVVDSGGGLAVSDGETGYTLPLPIAGLMSDVPCGTIATEYEQVSDYVKDMGCELSAPFMTLSFMALLVIPHLKIGDKGLFDVDSFSFVGMEA